MSYFSKNQITKQWQSQEESSGKDERNNHSVLSETQTLTRAELIEVYIPKAF
jgi:hypothetical protein